MRYCGSKARYMKELLPILTEHLGEKTWFYDAFMGGCNVLSEINTPHKVGIDTNQYVVALWREIRECSRGTIKQRWEAIHEHKVFFNIPPFLKDERPITESEYHFAKEDAKRGGLWFDHAALGYIGVCCSYGSAWFNGYAHFNEKRGENHIEESRKNLIKHIANFKWLRDTYFVNSSYDEHFYLPNSIIYCDPPYAGRKKYHKDFDNEKFWEWARKMSKMGHYVYVSEYTAPSDFKCIWEHEKKDGMGTTKSGKQQKKYTERLFVYNGN